MSGGVDSSTAAALLEQDGYDVTGIGLRIVGSSIKDAPGGASFCCGPEGFEDAKKTADKIGIPFFILDASPLFEKKVLRYFLNSYTNGLTPNPCVVCNEAVKLKLLVAHADALGMDHVATGHYAKIVKRNRYYLIHKGIDKTKDQSYFISRVTQQQLKKCIFPLGDLTKKQVRKIAAERGIPVAEKKESQDICFLKKGSHAEFIAHFFQGSTKEGPILDLNGTVLSTHQGIINYTIGQRKGLGISAPFPLYVIRINPQQNSIIIGREKDLFQKEMHVRNVKWFGGRPSDAFRADVKIRYAHKGAPAAVMPEKNSASVMFDSPQRAITPGQAAVMYVDDVIVGSGWITH